jgi:hypothetical protein
MHGSIGANFTVATSNHVDVVVVSNFGTITLDSIKVQIQQWQLYKCRL